ncbi:MAG: family 43 glycosylhydrolase [Clostridia bacterium]|nr:family 43 glycosylhydrolase [Clostridia bacterium]
MNKKLLLLVLALFLLGACFALSVSAAGQTVYVAGDNAGSDANSGTYESPFASLYAAFRALPYGGKVVVCGPVNLAATELPTTHAPVTVTSVDDEDYRASTGAGSAVINMSGNFIIKSAIKFENIDINVSATDLVFLCHGNYVCFGEGLTVTRSSDDINFPSITAGGTGPVSPNGSFVEIYSGNWFRMRGGARGAPSAPHEGDVLLAVYGGTFYGTFDLGGDTPTVGDCALLIYGGHFASTVCGATKMDGADIKTTGNIYVSVYGGSFDVGIRASRGGEIDGSVTVNALADISKTTTVGTAPNITGSKTFNKLESVTATASSDFTVHTLSAAEEAQICAQDTKLVEDARAARIPLAEDPLLQRDFTVTGTAEKLILPTSTDGVGDVNGDGRVSLADILTALRCFFAGTYNAKADPDLSGTVTLLDVLRLTDLAAHGARGFEPTVSENALENTMTLYGGARVTDGRIASGAAFGVSSLTNYTLLSELTLEDDAHVSLYFGCDVTDPAKINGYCFDVERTTHTVSLFALVDGAYRTVASRTLPLSQDTAQMLVVSDGGAVSLYYSDDRFDADPYFTFNLNLEAKGAACGVYVENATATLPVLSAHAPSTANTYTNVCLSNFTDPEIFFENGRYYIFGTQNNDGVKCCSTTNFRFFRDEGYALTAGNTFGDSIFKAANIVKYGDYYYMFYMAHSDALDTDVTAYASSTALTGPYENPTKQPLTSSLDFIGGQPFVDADGQVYLVYAHTTGGNKLYGAKITLQDGIAAIDLTTETCLLTPTEPWENAKAPVVECGYIIRHGDIYYLMYSGGNYNSTYGTGYATSENPLGPYEKYEFNPILASNDQAFGNGAASIFTSPDGSEHFFIYLRNYSPTKTRPLCTCIDRIKFVKDPSGGADILTIAGPSVTPQPLPRGHASTAEFSDYQKTRFIW